jgi:ribosomal protein S18 acetylase RimI-like enzyme
VNVRPAAGSDLRWLAEHDGHLDAAQLGRKIRDDEMFVAESDAGELLGLLRVDHLWSALPHIAQIRVLEPCRRRGVGRGLVEALKGASREAGATKLLSSTRPDYLEAQTWHRAVGFRECGRLSGLGPSGEPVVFFLKDIG